MIEDPEFRVVVRELRPTREAANPSRCAPATPIFAIGASRTCRGHPPMSAFEGKADIVRALAK